MPTVYLLAETTREGSGHWRPASDRIRIAGAGEYQVACDGVEDVLRYRLSIGRNRPGDQAVGRMSPPEWTAE